MTAERTQPQFPAKRFGSVPSVPMFPPHVQCRKTAHIEIPTEASPHICAGKRPLLPRPSRITVSKAAESLPDFENSGKHQFLLQAPAQWSKCVRNGGTYTDG